MSKAWRERQLAAIAAIGYEPTGNDQAWSGELDTQYDDVRYPGDAGRGKETHPDSANHISYVHGPSGSIRNPVDYEVGGVPGMTKFIGMVGPVESTNVDAHDFRGQSAIIRRFADTNYGPVGAENYTGILATLYAMQETNAYFPNEVSQVDLIKAI